MQPSTFTSLKGRTIDAALPVSVYRNLHRNGANGEPVYSVQQNGLVVGHVESISLEYATFVVQPAGQRRVRQTGRKVVHAFVRGYLTPEIDYSLEGKATYNPYKNSTFVDRSTGEELVSAHRVRISSTGVEYL